ASGTRELQVYLQASDGGDASPAVPVSAPAGTWTQVTIPLADFGGINQIARLTIQDRTGAAQPTYYLDNLELTTPAPVSSEGEITIKLDTQPDANTNFVFKGDLGT
ncbi:MAG: hypothetical protein KDD78_04805, partial [Caldilineaceae bacterium]|nr:hypothetical protein [Caldilineaceae bacterium]